MLICFINVIAHIYSFSLSFFLSYYITILIETEPRGISPSEIKDNIILDLNDEGKLLDTTIEMDLKIKRKRVPK